MRCPGINRIRNNIHCFFRIRAVHSELCLGIVILEHLPIKHHPIPRFGKIGFIKTVQVNQKIGFFRVNHILQMIADFLYRTHIERLIFRVAFYIRLPDIRPSGCAMLSVDVKRKRKGFNRLTDARAIGISVCRRKCFSRQILFQPMIKLLPLEVHASVLQYLQLRRICRIHQ